MKMLNSCWTRVLRHPREGLIQPALESNKSLGTRAELSVKKKRRKTPKTQLETRRLRRALREIEFADSLDEAVSLASDALKKR